MFMAKPLGELPSFRKKSLVVSDIVRGLSLMVDSGAGSRISTILWE
jgi:hypothetical protein